MRKTIVETAQNNGTSIVKMGEPFTFWQMEYSEGKKTEFVLTVGRAWCTEELPFFVRGSMMAELGASLAADASRGKKFVRIVATVENLGPRRGGLSQNLEIRSDKGRLYRLYRFYGPIMSTPKFFYIPKSRYRTRKEFRTVDKGMEAHTIASVARGLEPGQKGWFFFAAEIPAQETPVEIVGRLGAGSLKEGTECRLALSTASSTLPSPPATPRAGSASADPRLREKPKPVKPLAAFAEDYTHEPHRLNAFNWNPDLRGYCTWYAADRWLWAGNPRLPSVGNACSWLEDAQKQKIRIDKKTPVKGSIIVFGSSGINAAGHVAYVELIGKNFFQIVQMNAGDKFIPGTLKTQYFNKVTRDTLYIGQTNYMGMSVLGFIYPIQHQTTSGKISDTKRAVDPSSRVFVLKSGQKIVGRITKTINYYQIQTRKGSFIISADKILRIEDVPPSK